MGSGSTTGHASCPLCMTSQRLPSDIITRAGGSHGVDRLSRDRRRVVGLAVARALARAGREVVVVEAENAIGTGTSSRNSEVIHAGTTPDRSPLKTRLCVEGKAMLYAFCRDYGVLA